MENENKNVGALIPLSDMEKMANVISVSKLFGAKTREEALALMLVAQAEGLHPAIAARDYHIIEGRPALKADAMLARFQAVGGKVKWLKLDETCAKAIFSHPQGGDATIEWTIDMAKKAQLKFQNSNGTPGMWTKYPRQMLRARTLSEGIRTVFPGVVVGAYSEEEVGDMVHEEKQTRKTETIQAEITSEENGEKSKTPNRDYYESILKTARPPQMVVIKALSAKFSEKEGCPIDDMNEEQFGRLLSELKNYKPAEERKAA